MIRGRRARQALVLMLALCLAGCEGDQLSTPSVPSPAPSPPPPPPPEPPRATGEPTPLNLVQGGAAAEVRVADLFVVASNQQGEVEVEVRSMHEAVATARLEGAGLTAVVIVTAVGEGETSVSVSLKTSAGSAIQTILVAVGPPPAEPPRAIGEPTPLNLAQGGAAAEVRVADLFVVASSQQGEVEVEVRSMHEAVATARLEGAGLTAVVIVTPVGEGETSVSVLLKTSAGSAIQTILVTVGPPPAEPPRAIGEPTPLNLAQGGAAAEVRVADLFVVASSQQGEVEVEVRSMHEAVATARLEGAGLTAVVIVTPVGEGETSVPVSLKTSAGSAIQTILVTVGSPPAEPPRAIGEPTPLNLAQGEAAAEVRVADLFVVASNQQGEVEVEVRSMHEAVATARLEGAGLTAVVIVTPVGEGETSVSVLLKTSAGSAIQTILVTVGPPPAEPPRAIGEPTPLNLAQGGAAAEVRVADLFVVASNQQGEVEVEVRSEDETVAAVGLHGAGLAAVVTIEPVGAGETRVQVALRTPAGSAAQSIRVRVLPVATEPPRVIEEPEPFTLVEGGTWQRMHLANYFRIGNVTQAQVAEAEVHSEDERVVTVHLDGPGLYSGAIVTPGHPGETFVVVTVRNAAGSVSRRIPAAVLPAEPPRVARDFAPLAFVVGAPGGNWSVTGSFEPPGFLVEARSLDESVVRATPRNGSRPGFFFAGVEFDPVGPGETFVVVTARNAAGEAEFRVKVTVLAKLRLGLVSPLGRFGDPPMGLPEGAHWNLEVRALGVGAYAHTADSQVTIGIATDAPTDQLRVPEPVTVPFRGGRQRVFFRIEAPADNVVGEREATYAVFLASMRDLPSWMELSDEPVQVMVLDSPVAACEDLRVDASLERASDGTKRGIFRIQAPHPATSVSWAAPYVWRGNSPEGPTMTQVFPEELPFREVGDGFEQEVRLRWWDDDLRLTVQAPGCEPVELHCDEFTCDVR